MAESKVFQRPTGDIELLIGACHMSLLSSGVISMHADLALETTPWGCGQVLRRSHALLGSAGQALTLSLETHTASACLLLFPPGAAVFYGLTGRGAAPSCRGLNQVPPPQAPSPLRTCHKVEAGQEESAYPGRTLEEDLELPLRARPRVEFLQAEELGARPRPRCQQHEGCRACGNMSLLY
jgi:hypothetical protein